MRVTRNFLVLGVALAGAVSLAAGCGNRQEESSTQPSVSTVGTEIDDTVVTAKVKSTLFADPDIKGIDLKVETRNGVVQLSGFVDNQAQVDRAIAATSGVQGVRSVENGITLKEGKATVGNAVDDGIITARVKSALLAEPNVKSLDIAVSTRKGEVQLSGFVDSQTQMELAIAIARDVDGVTSVGNEMSVKN